MKKIIIFSYNCKLNSEMPKNWFFPQLKKLEYCKNYNSKLIFNFRSGTRPRMESNTNCNFFMQMVIYENVTFDFLFIISNLKEVLVGISYPFSFSSYRPRYCILGSGSGGRISWDRNRRSNYFSSFHEIEIALFHEIEF